MRGAHLFGMLVFRVVCICYKMKKEWEKDKWERVKNEGWDIVQKWFCLSLCCVEGANKVIRICAMLQKKWWNYDEMMMCVIHSKLHVSYSKFLKE